MSLILTGLESAFKDELSADKFNESVAEGTIAGLLGTQQVPSKGIHPLQVRSASLDWTQIDVTDGYTNSSGTNGAGVSAYDDYRSTVTLTQKDLVVGVNVAQGAVTPSALFGTSESFDINSLNNPSEGFITQFTEAIVAQAQAEFSRRIYTGFGDGTPTNGLLDIASAASPTANQATLVNTGIITGSATTVEGPWSVDNVIAKLSVFINSTSNAADQRTDNMVIISRSYYNLYRQALRNLNLNDPEFQSRTGESGFKTSVWIDDSRYTIVADPYYTQVVPRLIQADQTIVGMPSLSDLDDVSFFYDWKTNSVFFRVAIGGGVQVVEANHMLVGANSAVA